MLLATQLASLLVVLRVADPELEVEASSSVEPAAQADRTLVQVKRPLTVTCQHATRQRPHQHYRLQASSLPRPPQASSCSASVASGATSFRPSACHD